MNERLVEDWLTNANERTFQTPFAQSLLSSGIEVVRVGHGPHEHGKDIVAVDEHGRLHAYQLKSGDVGLTELQAIYGQLVALVETPVEHPGLATQRQHQSYLVMSGELSMPAADRLRVHNAGWKQRGYKPLKTISGAQLLTRFTRMSANFWPQRPQDARTFLSLYLADGRSTLDREAFAKIVFNTLGDCANAPKTEVLRRLAAVNLFSSYALAPFYAAANYWEIVQGWTMTAAYISWAATVGKVRKNAWHPMFRLSVDTALAALASLATETLIPGALKPPDLELDEFTRARSTICAAVLAARILLERKKSQRWTNEAEAKLLIEELITENRMFLWGESAIPLFLTAVWALDKIRADRFSDQLLVTITGTLAAINSRLYGPKLPSPYDSADDAIAKVLRRQFHNEKQMELRAAASYTLESLVTIITRRLWKNSLAGLWTHISRVSLARVMPDESHDLFLWRWEHKRGTEQSRSYDARQSWQQLLREARRSEDDRLPTAIKEHFDFSLLFLLCYPHRLNTALVKHLEDEVQNL